MIVIAQQMEDPMDRQNLELPQQGMSLHLGLAPRGIDGNENLPEMILAERGKGDDIRGTIVS